MLEDLFLMCTQILENQRQIMDELGIESEYEKKFRDKMNDEVKPTPHSFGLEKTVSIRDMLTPKLKK